MSCLLFVGAICLMDPALVEVRADLSSQVSGDFKYRIAGQEVPATVGVLELRLATGEYKGFRVHYGVRHISIVESRQDRGEERAFVGLTWRPFSGSY